MGVINKIDYKDYSQSETSSEKKIKFVVEVSEGYIKERADVELLKNPTNAVASVADFLCFKALERKVDEGETEFNISSKNINDTDALKIFNNGVAYLAACCLFISNNDGGTK